MKNKAKDSSTSERTRSWIDHRYGFHGQFPLLEKESGISAQKWKNLYYKRQGVTDEMLLFIKGKNATQFEWITSEIVHEKENRLSRMKNFPFSPSEEDSGNLKKRLLWVITEWASPKGKDLGDYLEEKSNLIERRKVKTNSDEWMNMIYGDKEPSYSMIEVVCTKRPQYSEWVTTGAVSSLGSVDPTDPESLAKYEKLMRNEFMKDVAYFKSDEGKEAIKSIENGN